MMDPFGRLRGRIPCLAIYLPLVLMTERYESHLINEISRMDIEVLKSLFPNVFFQIEMQVAILLKRN